MNRDRRLRIAKLESKTDPAAGDVVAEIHRLLRDPVLVDKLRERAMRQSCGASTAELAAIEVEIEELLRTHEERVAGQNTI